MKTVPVVVVEPALEVCRAFLQSVVDARVGPFAQSGLNEPLWFAVGAEGKVACECLALDSAKAFTFFSN